MGNRLSKITTRTGDSGETGLAGQRRLPKTDPRIAAIGDVDELNSALGVLRAQPGIAPHQDLLATIQQQLFNLGGELAMPEAELLDESAISALEQHCERLNAALPPLRDFVLPGGGPAAAHAHLARAVCRRAERGLWAAHDAEPLRPPLPRYLNRLSDLLFVLARDLARAAAAPETLWDKPRRPD